MAKPTVTANWATSLISETIDGKTFVNKIQPPTEIVTTGVKALESWVRPFLNYQLYVIGTWIEWLDTSLYPIGTVYTETTNTNPSTTLGVGTWTNIGNQVVGATTVYFWERDA